MLVQPGASGCQVGDGQKWASEEQPRSPATLDVELIDFRFLGWSTLVCFFLGRRYMAFSCFLYAILWRTSSQSEWEKKLGYQQWKSNLPKPAPQRCQALLVHWMDSPNNSGWNYQTNPNRTIFQGEGIWHHLTDSNFQLLRIDLRCLADLPWGVIVFLVSTFIKYTHTTSHNSWTEKLEHPQEAAKSYLDSWFLGLSLWPIQRGAPRNPS